MTRRTVSGLWGAALGLAGALLIAGCGGGGGGNEPPADAPPPEGRAVVSVRGATLEGEGGARVVIPASASLYEYQATIAKDSGGAPALPDNLVAAGSVYSLAPHGAVFTQPVKVTLPFDPAAVPAGAQVLVARGQPGGPWSLLPATVEGNTVSVTTTGFSYYVPVFFLFSATAQLPVTAPFAEVTMPGQTALAAQTPPALDRNGDSIPGIAVQPYSVFTQAQLATPMTLRLRGAVTADSDIDRWCGTRDVRLVVRAHTARIFPDPANATRTLVRTNHLVRYGSSFTWDEPVELASLPMPRDGIARSLDFTVNLAHYAYQMGVDDYPVDPWTGRPPSFDWGGPNPFPLTGAAGLSLNVTFECGASASFDQYAPSPRIALRRGFADTIGFVDVPSHLTVVEGEPVEFRVRIPAFGNAAPGGSTLEVAKWQRSFSGAPDIWFDLDPWNAPQSMAGWEMRDGSDDSLSPQPLVSRLRRPSVTRAEHDGTRYRAVVCQYGVPGGTPCLASPAALLTVTQNFVAPQVLTHPVSQQTVRENASGQVVQFGASFSGVPRPAVSWETKAPGSASWEPVDAATHRVNGSTLSTTRAFTLADRGREYRAVAHNGGGSVNTFSSVLFVTTGLEAPAITVQPQDVHAAHGAAVLLAASATGGTPLSYQWLFNAVPITGANGPLLALNGVNAGNAGLYTLEVSNRENRVRSRAARLTVAAAATPPPAVAAPKIVTEPAGLRVHAGDTATFAVAALGSPPLKYQWLRNGRAIEGATAAVLTMAKVAEAEAGRYAVIVANDGGRTTSAEAELEVRPEQEGTPPTAPQITTQPMGLVVNVGQGATFAVAASGSAPFSYQWRRNGVAIAGAAGPVLAFTGATGADAGQYDVVVGNAAGQAVSALAGLVVTEPPGAPRITAQPGSRSVLVGESATFAFDVAGNPAPSCVWLRNGIALGGAGPCGSYTVAAATLADHGAIFSVLVYNAGGYVFSSPAVLSVADLVPPSIGTQPASVTVTEGASAQFSVQASANGPLSYQWERAGAPIAGATGAQLTLAATTLADSGAQLRVRVCNGAQADNRCTLSQTATLTVVPPLPAGALTATQVVAGYEWSLALRADGTVWGWGWLHRVDGSVVVANLAPSELARRPVRLYPATLVDVRQIAGWYDGFWALTGEPGSAGSRVLHWGRARSGNDGRGADGNGNLGNLPSQRENASPVPMLERRMVAGSLQAVPVDRVCSLAATSDRVLLIRALNEAGEATDCRRGTVKTVWVAGTLTAFGSDAVGVVVPVSGLPMSGTPNYSAPARVVAAQPSSTASGGAALVLLEDGRAFGWGSNPYNAFGTSPPNTGTLGGIGAPQALREAWGPLDDAFFSYGGLLGLRRDGTVPVSGMNFGGELGLGAQAANTVNHGPLNAVGASGERLSGVTALAATDSSQVTLALVNGEIHTWGAAGQALRGNAAASGVPVLLPASGRGWLAVQASHGHALAIAPSGAVYAWGSGLRGALGDGADGSTALAPTLVTVP